MRELPPALSALSTLAFDLRWASSHAAQALWRRLDPQLWEATGNPCVILESVGRSRLSQLSVDVPFLTALDRLTRSRSRLLATSWCAREQSRLSQGCIAYFCMEFGLGTALPLYAGGLGVLAGDHLKSASDLGVPLVAVGILFQQGSFRQRIDARGQHELYPNNDPGSLPLRPTLRADGSRLRVCVAIGERSVWLRIWQVEVGRVRLYLLDANDPLNSPADRMITKRLYGGGKATRLRQEIVLGIGGYRLLRELAIPVEVAHLNEGHAAFAVLERACQLAREQGLSLREALWVSRAGNVFTTHTSVGASFDSFEPAHVARSLLRSGGDFADFDPQEILALGQRGDEAKGRDPFSMARLALRGCAFVNAVSRAHEAQTRKVLGELMPESVPPSQPLTHITNGVHIPSWTSAAADALWSAALGANWWQASEARHSPVSFDDDGLWQLRESQRAGLVSYVRSLLKRQGAARGVLAAATILRPDALTLCFARRFTGYKRPTLLLRQPERLLRLLTSNRQPVQLIIAGKAHPADVEGKELLEGWLRFAAHPQLAGRCLLLADYDLTMAQQLVQGADVWLNTPLGPWEACGTSGMKVLANGGLNLSSRDGWWAEAEASALGWSLGKDQDGSDDEDAEQLFTLLEREVVPTFYERNQRGLPERWLAYIRGSMDQLTLRFGSQRMVRDYAQHIYAPAQRELARRAAERGGARKTG